MNVPSPLLGSNGDVPGFELITDFLTPMDQEILMFLIDKQNWMTDYELKRYQMYRKSSTSVFPIPEFLLSMILKLNQSYGTEFDHVIISENSPGYGSVQPHTDSLYWGDIIIGISLLSDCKMTLSKLTPENNDSVNIDLPARSLYILSGDARYKYMHGIQSRYITSRRVAIIVRSMSNRKVILSPIEITYCLGLLTNMKILSVLLLEFEAYSYNKSL